MQFQVQQLINKNTDPVTLQKEKDDLDLFVGVHSDLGDPFNVFFRVDDAISNSDLIYFYAQSIGKKKIVMWGVYDRTTNEFLIDNSCVYHPNSMKIMLDKWKSNAYEFAFSSVKNRIATKFTRMNAFDERIGGSGVKNAESLLARFRVYFVAKLIKDGIISRNSVGLNQADLKTLINVPSEQFEREYDTLIDNIYDSITLPHTGEEKEIYAPFFELIYAEMDTLEDENNLRKVFESTNSADVRNAVMKIRKGTDPYMTKILKYIYVNYFILVFCDFEEYRIAKYIVKASAIGVSNSSNLNRENARETKRKLNAAAKGSFIYEWIVELAKILRVSNVQKFITDYAMILIVLLEEKINLTKTGVIGDRSTNINVVLEQIAEFFTEFISLSRYSKISVINDMKQCPMIEDCEFGDNELCGVYNHGSSMQSKYDLS